MVTLDELQKLWSEDANIDMDCLDVESIKIPKLHSKYFSLFSQERMRLKRMTFDYKCLHLEKYEFYTQGPTKEQIGKGWIVPAKGVILKNEVERYMEADQQLIDTILRIDYQKEKVDFLESIIDNLNRRSFQIKGAIDFLKWKNGG